MTTLIDFIEARLAEDEATAQAVDPGGRPLEGGKYLEWRSNDTTNAIGDHTGYVVAYEVRGAAPRAHIARHDPARVLREVAAKREMLSRAARSLADADKLEKIGAQPVDVFTIRAPAEYTLSLLAAPHSDHPDFDPNWSTA